MLTYAELTTFLLGKSLILSVAIGFRCCIIPKFVKTKRHEQKRNRNRHRSQDSHHDASFSIETRVQLLVDILSSYFVSDAGPNEIKTDNDQNTGKMACKWLQSVLAYVSQPPLET